MSRDRVEQRSRPRRLVGPTVTALVLGLSVASVTAPDAGWASPRVVVAVSAAPRTTATPCFGVDATIVGTDRPDDLVGTPGPDVISSGDGNDVIHGLGGDDTLCGGDDVDVLYGGAGNDRLAVGQRTIFDQIDLLVGGPGNDLLRGSEIRSTVVADYINSPAPIHADLTRGVATGQGRDRLVNVGISGSAHDDVIVGSPRRDYLFGNGGEDTIDGLGGQDEISGDSYSAYLADDDAATDIVRGGDEAGPGDDIVTTGGADRITSGAGNDRVTGHLDGGSVDAGDGNDRVSFRGGGRIDGGAGRDRIAQIGAAAARIDAGEDDDTVLGVLTVEPSTLSLGAEVTRADALTLRVPPSLTHGAGGDLEVDLDGHYSLPGDQPVSADWSRAGQYTFVLSNQRLTLKAGPLADHIEVDGAFAIDADLFGGPDLLRVDAVRGYEGAHTVDVRAGAGADEVRGRLEASSSASADLVGGPGADSMSVFGSLSDARATLLGGDGDDRLEVGYLAGTLDGGAGRDDLTGSDLDDVLRGAAGADRLDGQGGDDRLDGGPGTDVGTGGPGADTCVSVEKRRFCES